MGILDTNLYAQNVDLKNKSLGGFTNPLANMQMPNLQLPPMPPAPQTTPPANNQNFLSRILFGNNPPPQSVPMNATASGQMNAQELQKKQEIEKFLKSIPEEDRLLASMRPQAYMDMKIKNQEKTTKQKNYELYANDPDYKKTADIIEGRDVATIDEIEKIKYFNSKGLDYYLLNNALGVTQYTPLMEKRDEQFAKVVNEFYDKGGFAVQNSNIRRIDYVLNNLINRDDVTGVLQGTLPDELLAFLGYDEAVNTKEAVASIVYQTLRATLGAQFTEKEGQRLISASFNPLLSPEANVRRLTLMLQEIVEVASAKQERIMHIETYGTLAGYEGEMPNYDVYKDDPEAMLRDVRAEAFDITKAYMSVDDYKGLTVDQLQRIVASLPEDSYERAFINQNENKILANLAKEE